jgi:hypothetical protein
VTARLAGRILLGAGALVVVYGAARWWHGERVSARMRPTTCTLLSKKVESKLLVATRRGTAARARYRDEAHLVFTHSLAGQHYTFTEDFTEDRAPHTLTGYEEGGAYPCRYDPLDPGRGTVTTSFDRRDDVDTLLLGGVVMFLGAMTPRIWRAALAGYGEMRPR